MLLLVPTGCRSSPELETAPVREVASVRLSDVEAAQLAGEIREEMGDRVAVAEGLELELWAPERLMIDPHALDVDDQGAVHVASSARTRTQRAVSQRFRSELAATLQHRTVEDLRSFLRTGLAPELSDVNHEWLPDLNGDGSHDWRDLTVQDERVYRIEDTSGDGRADLSRVIVEDFGSEVTDIVGGLLVHDEDVYVGVVPGVWRMRDTSGDGIPDVKETLSEGYGVRLGFFAHGMSGITLGPDGRIYWAIGDVGFSVVDREGRRWDYPNQGAILRANPDGSDFEVFAAGIRNVYEFAFDAHGNLIGADNDSDQPGERERLVYLVEGSDSGWRTGSQYGKYTDPRNNRYRVWMAEGLHAPEAPHQPAHITPPIAPYVNGPAGLVYNPGTGLSDRWRDHFFVAEAKGAASSVHAFSLRPRGAGFELARDTVLVDGGLLTTGMDFGPDGALYLADLVVKIKPELGGRVWKLDDPLAAGSPLRRETQTLLAASFAERTAPDLRTLLGHADMRVRKKAQFELVDRAEVRTLLSAAEGGEALLARLHGIWGLGQLARRDPEMGRKVVPLLRDTSAEVRAQAAKVIGEARYGAAGDALVPLLADESSRVRFFAAQALGQLRHAPAVEPLITMLASDDGRDTYLRHAGSLALARIGSVKPLLALTDHPSRAVRVTAVVALRRMRNPGVAEFLGDRDEGVVLEAARAINDDGGIAAAFPALAGLLEENRFSNEALLRRVINANLRLGTVEGVRRVTRYAARRDSPEALRVEAIAGLGVWADPSEFDRVDGAYLGPRQRRDAGEARAAVTSLLAPVLSGGASAAVRGALAEAAGRAGARGAAPALLRAVREDASVEVRIASLGALAAMESPQLPAGVQTALADADREVREAALGMTVELGLPEATTAELLSSLIEQGTSQEQQRAIEALGKLSVPEAESALERLVERWVAGTLPPAVELDLLEAVQGSGFPRLRTRVYEIVTVAAARDPMAAYKPALHGGDALRGRQIVRRHEGARCIQCHSVGEAGSTVGPDLRGVGSRLSRTELLRELVDPSARIAPGFGRSGVPSVMPPMHEILSRGEMRDVVEYLTTLK